uniref:Gypsy retrotransposon integrase-like protein 1 n=1 Tax=Paramormyrops kingsleyae TaxID=1676925 RepID=A0A3B3SWI2_9TELE
MLGLIHKSHLGMVKSKQRAREVLYWPGMNAEIEQVIRDCSTCADFQNRLPREPLKLTEAPLFPFEEVASDLFEFEGKHYVLIVDYYSKYIEVEELKDLLCRSTIKALKSQFCCYGIPTTLRTDNGPQFASEEFKDFCKDYGIIHNTSSPHTPHSNSEAEWAVQTVKKLWSKADDKYLTLLDYRTTRLETVGLSPAQLLMGRRPRNKLPAARVLLAPATYDPVQVKCQLHMGKATQKFYYDQKRASKPRASLMPGEEVRIQPYPGERRWTPAVVLRPHSMSRSYVVDCGNKEYRRNVQHLRRSTAVANQPHHRLCAEPWVDPSGPYKDKEPHLPASSELPEVAVNQPDSSAQTQPVGQYITKRVRTVKPPDNPSAID